MECKIDHLQLGLVLLVRLLDCRATEETRLEDVTEERISLIWMLWCQLVAAIVNLITFLDIFLVSAASVVHFVPGRKK